MKLAACDVSAIIMLTYCIARIETRRKQAHMPYGRGGTQGFLSRMYPNTCNCCPCNIPNNYNQRFAADAALNGFSPNSPSNLTVLQEPLQSLQNSDRNFYFAGDDGIIRVVDSEEPVDTVFINNYTKDPKNNMFWLYSRANPYTPNILFIGESQSIVDSNFDEAKETVFLVHGWKGHSKTNMNRVLTEVAAKHTTRLIISGHSLLSLATKSITRRRYKGTCLKNDVSLQNSNAPDETNSKHSFLNDNDVNVIVFDWSKLANTSYNTAKAATAAVGITLGQFINWMFKNGFVMYHKIHLVGISLGGHLVGNAGRETGGAVARITALDPAGSLWYEDRDRLVSTDAQYVEVIHTNSKRYGVEDAWALGYMHPCGDADFYPNGGVMMEGCLTSNVCSHCRSYEYMAYSLANNSFKANKCEDYNEMASNKCTGPTSLMGNSDLYKEGRGVFRVNTNPFYPYV